MQYRHDTAQGRGESMEMKIEQFEVAGLAQYSYIVSDGGEAVGIDPERDVERYIAYAQREGLTIKTVVETHIHADFASGSVELAARTGATLALSGYAAGGPYEYAMPHRALRESDEIHVGTSVLRAMHTPGHTPEHLSFLLFAKGADEPSAMFSGDFLFVGSLGRPDLLGEAVKVQLARAMYRSVQQLQTLPDAMKVYPGHGSGSFCGSGMSEAADTTLGTERQTNPFFDRSRDAFIANLLDAVPAMPTYYPRMKALNASGAKALDLTVGGKDLSAARVAELVVQGDVTLLDVRSIAAFADGHVPGSVHIAAGDSLALWAGWLLDSASQLVLITDAGDDGASRLALARVGLDAVLGHLDGGIVAWPSTLARTDAVTEVGDAVLLDVRNDAERSHRSIPGSMHIMLGDLPVAMAALAKETSFVTVCESGLRASIAASLLQRAGFEHVATLAGGMAAWSGDAAKSTAR